jgi:hypothetical protein
MEFDEQTKTDFYALPGPEGFNKTEVNKMVSRMQEETAFHPYSLTFLTHQEILAREKRNLKEMEERFRSFGNVGAVGMDREMTKQVDRLRRNIAEAKDLAFSLPEL